MEKLLASVIVFFITMANAVGATHEALEVSVLTNPKKSVHAQFVKAFQLFSAQNKVKLHSKVVPYNQGCAEPSEHWVVAVGIESLRACFEAKRKRNLFSVFVSLDAVVELQKRYNIDGVIPSIVLDQPLERHIEFIMALFPKTESISILGDANNVPSVVLQQLRARYDVDLKLLQEFSPSSLLDMPMHYNRRNQAIVTLPKTQTRSNSEAKWLLYYEYKNKIPVIGYSADYVQAGAVGAIYSTPEQIALQTSEFFAHNVMLKTHLPTKYEFPKYFYTSVNTSVLSALELHLDVDQRVVKQFEDSNIPSTPDGSSFQMADDTI